MAATPSGAYSVERCAAPDQAGLDELGRDSCGEACRCRARLASPRRRALSAYPPSARPSLVVSLAKVAAKALVWTSLESFALSGLSLISLFVFARLLSASDFGITAVALAIVQLLTVPVELLFHDALIQRKELEPIHVNSAFTASVALGATLCAGCWLGADALERWMGEPHLGRVLQWMSFSLVGMGFGSVLVAMQRRNLQFRSLALRSVLGRSGSAVIAISLAYFGCGLWSLVVQQVLLVCLGTLVLWTLAEERPRLQIAWGPTRDLLRFGVFPTVNQVLGISIQRIFMILVGGYLGSETVGIFSLAFRGIDMLRDLLAGAVAQIAMPLFSKLRDDRDALFAAYNRSVQHTTLVTYPVFVGLAVCAQDVVSIAFGKAWTTAAPYFAVVALLNLRFFLRMYSAPLLRAVGKPLVPIMDVVAQNVFTAIAMFWFGRRSIDYAMLAWALRVVITGPFDFWLTRRAIDMSYRRQLDGAGLPALAAGVMAVVVLLFKQWLPDSLAPAIRLVPLVLVGAAVYMSTILLVDRERIRLLISFVGHTTETRRS